mgnify:CR=1 FL=1
MRQHSENALKISKWLENNDNVSWVNYPGLSSSKYNNLAKKYLIKGQSGIVTFGLKGGFDAGKKVADDMSHYSFSAPPDSEFVSVCT